ncbi:MAG: hypothetical protein JWQ22_794 [Devosia sp.]|nr:hypothetical protein [Devosia sp.]
MLKGRPVLIVEEEFLIALDIQRMLEGLGVGQTLLARNASEARQLRQHWPDLALAIIELRLDHSHNKELPTELSAAGVPLVVTTGDFGLSRNLASAVPILVKPIPEETMASAVARALAINS